MKHLGYALLLCVALSCGNGSATTEAPAGSEGGVCYGNGTCDSGLTCLSNRCVVWSGGADVGGSSDDGNGTISNNTTPNNTGVGIDVGGIDFGDPADQPPGAPLALVAQNGAPVSIDLTWTDNSDDEGGFVIERKDEFFATDWADIALTEPNATSFNDPDVVKGVEYTYRVRAINNAGSSDTSNEAPVRAPWPTLQADIVEVFDRGCGTGNNACHARNQYAATADRACRGWLALENAPLGSTIYDEDFNATGATGCPDQDLHYRLTQITAWQCGESDFVNGDTSYVIAGDLQNSYVWQKMEGTRLCDLADGPSEIMPSAGQLDPVDRILIRQWILGGAAE